MKNRGNKEIPLAIVRTSTIMRNPLPELCREGLHMIVVVSLIVLLKGFPTIFPVVHPIPTSPLNDFYTCSTYFYGSRINTYAYIHDMHRYIPYFLE